MVSAADSSYWVCVIRFRTTPIPIDVVAVNELPHGLIGTCLLSVSQFV
jgi:hypothetical protein